MEDSAGGPTGTVRLPIQEGDDLEITMVLVTKGADGLARCELRLVAHPLGPRDALQLQTAIVTITQLHEVNAAEALALLGHVFLMYLDW